MTGVSDLTLHKEGEDKNLLKEFLTIRRNLQTIASGYFGRPGPEKTHTLQDL